MLPNGMKETIGSIPVSAIPGYLLSTQSPVHYRA